MTITALSSLTSRHVVALSTILGASSREDKVVYVRTDAEGETRLIEGTARGLFADADGQRGLGADADIREAYLRITHRSGLEGFYPIADLIDAEINFNFSVYDWS